MRNDRVVERLIPGTCRGNEHGREIHEDEAGLEIAWQIRASAQIT